MFSQACYNAIVAFDKCVIGLSCSEIDNVIENPSGWEISKCASERNSTNNACF